MRNSSQTSKIIITISIQDFIIIYIHSSKSRVNISEDTRLNMTTKEAEEWVETLNKSESFKWKDPNFHTECWHLTLLAHHLSILPCIRRYQRRLRAIRYLKSISRKILWKWFHGKSSIDGNAISFLITLYWEVPLRTEMQFDHLIFGNFCLRIF